jgi:hypothetical protein
MSTNLAIQLSERAFALLSEQAAAIGKTAAELAASVVEKNFAGGQRDDRDLARARDEFEGCFGGVDLGRPIGIANSAIDSDLAREYGAATRPA